MNLIIFYAKASPSTTTPDESFPMRVWNIALGELFHKWNNNKKKHALISYFTQRIKFSFQLKAIDITVWYTNILYIYITYNITELVVIIERSAIYKKSILYL